jgi:hypothetical protein|tara:strand:- start:8191 stop:8418 length:228 start_codon:yes stop_codon:yes gene_type:complete
MDAILCVLQAYATQIINDCDKCNEEFLKKFLEAYSLYKTVLLAIEEGCDPDTIAAVQSTLENYVLTMECRNCGNC